MLFPTHHSTARCVASLLARQLKLDFDRKTFRLALACLERNFCEKEVRKGGPEIRSSRGFFESKMGDDASIIAKGLGKLKRCVGNTPDAGAYAFTHLELSPDSKVKVADLSSVAKFSELTHVVLNGQAIADAAPLASLPYLAEVQCRKNMLTQSLDALMFRHCKRVQDGIADTSKDIDAAWASGDRSIGSVLTSVDLSFNLIRGPLGDHSLHRFLRRLNLAHNDIGEVGDGLTGLPQLKYLNLSANKLKQVDSKSCQYL